jgi:hypothetical protein
MSSMSNGRIVIHAPGIQTVKAHSIIDRHAGPEPTQQAAPADAV